MSQTRTMRSKRRGRNVHRDKSADQQPFKKLSGSLRAGRVASRKEGFR